jgi:hypothetical protein
MKIKMQTILIMALALIFLNLSEAFYSDPSPSLDVYNGSDVSGPLLGNTGVVLDSFDASSSFDFPQISLPDDLVAYLIMETGTYIAPIDTPVKKHEGVLSIIPDYVRLVRQGEIFTTNNAIHGINAIDSFIQELEANAGIYGVNSIKEVISPTLIAGLSPQWESAGYDMGYPIVPGWRGFKVELEASEREGKVLWLLPLLSGDILLFAETRHDNPEESREDCNDLFTQFKQILGDFLSATSVETEAIAEASVQDIETLSLETIDSVSGEKCNANKNEDDIAISLSPSSSISSDNPYISVSILPKDIYQDFSNLDSISFNISGIETFDIEGAEFTGIRVELRDTSGRIVSILKQGLPEDGNIELTREEIDAVLLENDTGFDFNVVNIKVFFELDITGYDETIVRGDKEFTKHIDGAIINSGSFTISELSINKSLSNIGSEEADFLVPLVADLFGMNTAQLRQELASAHSLPVYQSTFDEWLEEAGRTSLYNVAMKIAFTKQNIRFLDAVRGESFDYSNISQRVLLESFEAEIMDVLERQNISVGDEGMSWHLMAEMNRHDLELIREESWLTVGGRGEQGTIYTQIQDEIIPKIKSLLNIQEIFDKGASFSNSVYWLGLNLYEKYNAAGFFTSEEKERMEQQIRIKIASDKITYDLDRVPNSWREQVEDSVHTTFAIQKALQEIGNAGLQRTLDNFIDWVSKDFIPQGTDLNSLINFVDVFPKALRDELYYSVLEIPESERTSRIPNIDLNGVIDSLVVAKLISSEDAESIKNNIRSQRGALELNDSDISIVSNLNDYRKAIDCIESMQIAYINKDGSPDNSEIERRLGIKYSQEDIDEISNILSAYNVLQPEVSKLLGEASLTYQSDISTMDIQGFIQNTIFENGKRYLIDVYDPNTGFILDSLGAPDASIAAIGLAIAYLAGLYKEGILENEDIALIRDLNRNIKDVEDMLELSMQSLIDIQNKQPKGEWVEILLERYPLELIEKLREESDDRLNELAASSEAWRDWIEIEWLTPLGIPAMESNETAKNLFDQQLSVEDIGYIRDINNGDIDAIKKYGWGGWLYHYVDVITSERSSENIELTSLDTILTAIGFYQAAMIFPDLRDKAMEFIRNINMDGLFYTGVDRKGQERYLMDWMPVASEDSFGKHDFRGFADPDWVYRAHEELATEFVRAIWLVDRNGNSPLDLRSELYPTRRSDTAYWLPEFYPSGNGASWTHSLLPIDLRGNDAQGTDWHYNDILGMFYNRVGASKSGLYSPYNAQVGSMEMFKRGYEMSTGVDPVDPAWGGGGPSVEADGTFSIYSLNMSALPGESLFSLLHQWVTNPKLWEGNYGFRASNNPIEGFISSSYYTFDIVTMGLNTLNALYGTAWNACREDELMQNVYESFGINYDASADDEDIADILPIVGQLDAEAIALQSQLEGLSGLKRSEIEYDIAEIRVQQVVELAKAMIGIDINGDGCFTDEDFDTRRYGVQILREFIDKSDEYYNEASGYLQSLAGVQNPQLKAKVLALQFVVNKNRFRYQEQKDSFKDLTGYLAEIEGSSLYESCFESAFEIISNYDYEASVMWKDWDMQVRQFIPVLSEEEIRSDLGDHTKENPRTSTYPELEEYLGALQSINAFLPEESGVLSTYVYGSEKMKGFLDLTKEVGLERATQIFRKEFRIQAELRPYVEEMVLGRRLDLTNPDGKDAGFLASWAARVEGGLREEKSGPGWGYVCVIDDTQDWRKNPHDIRWQMAFERRMLEHTWFKTGEKFDPSKGTDKELKLWHDIASIAKARSTLGAKYLYNDVGDLRLLKGEVAIGSDYFGHFYHTAPLAITSKFVTGDGTLSIENNSLEIDYHLDESNSKVTVNLNLLNQDWSCYDNMKLTVDKNGQGPDSFKIIIRNKNGEEIAFRVNNLDDAREIVLPRYGTSPAYRGRDWQTHLSRNNIEFLGDEVSDWMQDWENIESIVIEIEAENAADLGSGTISISLGDIVEVAGESTLTSIEGLTEPFLAYYEDEWVIVKEVNSHACFTRVINGKKEKVSLAGFLLDWDGKVRQEVSL